MYTEIQNFTFYLSMKIFMKNTPITSTKKTLFIYIYIYAYYTKEYKCKRVYQNNCVAIGDGH